MFFFIGLVFLITKNNVMAQQSDGFRLHQMEKYYLNGLQDYMSAQYDDGLVNVEKLLTLEPHNKKAHLLMSDLITAKKRLAHSNIWLVDNTRFPVVLSKGLVPHKTAEINTLKLTIYHLQQEISELQKLRKSNMRQAFWVAEKSPVINRSFSLGIYSELEKFIWFLLLVLLMFLITWMSSLILFLTEDKNHGKQLGTRRQQKI